MRIEEAVKHKSAWKRKDVGDDKKKKIKIKIKASLSESIECANKIKIVHIFLNISK